MFESLYLLHEEKSWKRVSSPHYFQDSIMVPKIGYLDPKKVF